MSGCVVIDFKRRNTTALLSRAAALRAQGAAQRREHSARALQHGHAAEHACVA